MVGARALAGTGQILGSTISLSACNPKFNNWRSDIFTTDRLDHVVRWRSKQLGDDGELVDMVFPREQRLALKHFRENTTSAPYIYFDIVLLPGKHDFWCSVVARRDIAGHLRVLNAGQSKVANFEVAILVHKDVAGLEIAMDDPSRVDVLQAALLRR